MTKQKRTIKKMLAVVLTLSLVLSILPWTEGYVSAKELSWEEELSDSAGTTDGSEAEESKADGSKADEAETCVPKADETVHLDSVTSNIQVNFYADKNDENPVEIYDASSFLAARNWIRNCVQTENSEFIYYINGVGMTYSLGAEDFDFSGCAGTIEFMIESQITLEAAENLTWGGNLQFDYHAYHTNITIDGNNKKINLKDGTKIIFNSAGNTDFLLTNVHLLGNAVFEFIPYNTTDALADHIFINESLTAEADARLTVRTLKYVYYDEKTDTDIYDWVTNSTSGAVFHTNIENFPTELVTVEQPEGDYEKNTSVAQDSDIIQVARDMFVVRAEGEDSGTGVASLKNAFELMTEEKAYTLTVLGDNQTDSQGGDLRQLITLSRDYEIPAQVTALTITTDKLKADDTKYSQTQLDLNAHNITYNGTGKITIKGGLTIHNKKGSWLIFPYEDIPANGYMPDYSNLNFPNATELVIDTSGLRKLTSAVYATEDMFPGVTYGVNINAPKSKLTLIGNEEHFTGTENISFYDFQYGTVSVREVTIPENLKYNFELLQVSESLVVNGELTICELIEVNETRDRVIYTHFQTSGSIVNNGRLTISKGVLLEGASYVSNAEATDDFHVTLTAKSGSTIKINAGKAMNAAYAEETLNMEPGSALTLGAGSTLYTDGDAVLNNVTLEGEATLVRDRGLQIWTTSPGAAAYENGSFYEYTCTVMDNGAINGYLKTADDSSGAKLKVKTRLMECDKSVSDYHLVYADTYTIDRYWIFKDAYHRFLDESYVGYVFLTDIAEFPTELVEIWQPMENETNWDFSESAVARYRSSEIEKEEDDTFYLKVKAQFAKDREAAKKTALTQTGRYLTVGGFPGDIVVSGDSIGTVTANTFSEALGYMTVAEDYKITLLGDRALDNDFEIPSVAKSLLFTSSGVADVKKDGDSAATIRPAELDLGDYTLTYAGTGSIEVDAMLSLSSGETGGLKLSDANSTCSLQEGSTLRLGTLDVKGALVLEEAAALVTDTLSISATATLSTDSVIVINKKGTLNTLVLNGAESGEEFAHISRYKDAELAINGAIMRSGANIFLRVGLLSEKNPLLLMELTEETELFTTEQVSVPDYVLVWLPEGSTSVYKTVFLENGSVWAGKYVEGLHVELADVEKEFYYTGSAIKPAIKVTNNGQCLTEGVDYTVSYSNNINVSTNNKNAKITVKGNGNLSGSESVEFEIKQRNIEEALVSDITVIRNKDKAKPVVVYNGKLLREKKDYTLENPNQKFEEDSSIVISGTGNFTGTTEANVHVVEAADAQTFKVTVGKEKLTYNGDEQYPSVTVYNKKDKAKVAIDSENYHIIWPENAKDAGKYEFYVVGAAPYSGYVKCSYKINPLKTDVAVDATGLAADGYVFDPKGVTIPEGTFSLTTGDLELVEGKDFTVTYSGNKKVGDKAKYNFKFTGNYKGSKAKGNTFKIVPASLSDFDAEGELQIGVAGKTAAKAGIYKVKPVVCANNTLLKNSDMTITYYTDEDMTAEMAGSNKAEPGSTVYMKIVGKGNYAAKDENDFVTASYKIVSADKDHDLGKAKIVDVTTGKAIKATYTGKAIEPTVKVLIGKTEVPADAYEVEFINNVNKGKATVIIKATDTLENGDPNPYAGSKAATFSIANKGLKGLPDLFKDMFN